jgi:hypothetical protein
VPKQALLTFNSVFGSVVNFIVKDYFFEKYATQLEPKLTTINIPAINCILCESWYSINKNIVIAKSNRLIKKMVLDFIISKSIKLIY